MARRVLALLLLQQLLISVAQTCEQQVTAQVTPGSQKVNQMLIHDMGAKGKYANIIRERNMRS